MISAKLVDACDGVAIGTETFWTGPHKVVYDEKSLLVVDPAQAHGVFKTAKFISAGTIQFVIPDANGSLILTDIAVFGDKVNSGSIEVLFTDDTNTETFVFATVTDAPVASAWMIRGRVQGWRDARIDVVVSQNVKGSVVLGYTKVPLGRPYGEWEKLR